MNANRPGRTLGADVGRVLRWAAGPTGLAVLLTVLNAAKPAVVDDTAYLLTARHIAAHPLDPYGFDLFWYKVPEPATEVLLPPVVPYWLAAGHHVVGDNLPWLKLWLLPFALILSHAMAFLLGRFAPGSARQVLPALVLGPAVLPLFSVMLDVPALALGLAAVALMVRGCDGPGYVRVVLAGYAAGLAAETKYTMLTLPAVLFWYGLLARRPVRAGLSVGVAVGTFVAWEAVIHREYGESHFLHHVREQSEPTGDAVEAVGAKLLELAETKMRLVQPLFGHLGWLGAGAGLLAAAAVGAPRWLLAATAGLVGASFLAVSLTPGEWSVLVRGKSPGAVRLDLPTAVFVTAGVANGLAVLTATGLLLARRASRDRGTWFLAGWLLIELAGYFALTPFPAARRVIGLAVVGGLVAARAASAGGGRVPGWVPGFGVAAGLSLFALDFWDALPEKILTERAAAVATPAEGRAVWYNGHWGFQYYCERAGMRPVVPGWAWDDPPASELRAGDWLVFPVIPDDGGFYRPYHGGAKFQPDPDALELVETFTRDDPLPAATIPTMYGGTVPVRGRSHPRLVVAVYRVTRDWSPQRAP